MKIQIGLAVFVVALSQMGGAQYQQSQINPPNTAVPSAANPLIPVVTGPIYEIPPENTPPSNDSTSSGTTQAPPPYTPLYESTAPTYAIPPQNTPPPTTPGENP